MKSSTEAKPGGVLVGELQCPKEFATFTLRRFDSIESKVDKLSDQVGDAVLQFSTHTARIQAREESIKQWRRRFTWGVTTAIALAAAAASVASAMH